MLTDHVTRLTVTLTDRRMVLLLDRAFLISRDLVAEVGR
jgi:hypothetical protein